MKTAPMTLFPQINQITHWLDSSNVYGSNPDEAVDLRSFVGGRMAVRSSRLGTDLLPDNPEDMDCRSQEGSCFRAGECTPTEKP